MPINSGPWLKNTEENKMDYYKELKLNNGKSCVLRAGKPEDAEEVLYLFNTTHAETDNLLTYPEENNFTVQDESDFLEKVFNSEKDIEILAFVDGKIAGSAGIEQIGGRIKIKHRAEFGISVLKEFWGMGVGSHLTEACIECAKNAGFEQIELNVIADNETAVRLYKRFGFKEFGLNQKGFKNKEGKYQPLMYMCLELE